MPLRVEEVGLVRELQDGAALLLREVRRVPRGPAQLVHRQPFPALVARAGVPPAAPPAPHDYRHVDQVLVVLVAEEALAQLGQPVQQDVVVGPLSDEGLVVVKVLAGRPQAQVGVVVLPRAGQLPVVDLPEEQLLQEENHATGEAPETSCASTLALWT